MKAMRSKDDAEVLKFTENVTCDQLSHTKLTLRGCLSIWSVYLVAAEVACDRFAIFIVHNAAERISSLRLSQYSEEGSSTPKTWASVWSKRYETASNMGTTMSKIEVKDIACPMVILNISEFSW